MSKDCPVQDLRSWARFPAMTAYYGQQGAEGFSPKSYTRRLRSEGQPFTLSLQEGNLFHVFNKSK